jgi:hypothetical protein
VRRKRLFAGMILAVMPVLAYAQAVSYKDAIMVIAVNVEAKMILWLSLVFSQQLRNLLTGL